ncbi:MAG: hypothetical protein PHE06_09785, partial [Lachnospiraceae bacterium]|nr:hypothetical protein [Lachnospiraceae bacterium]
PKKQEKTSCQYAVKAYGYWLFRLVFLKMMRLSYTPQASFFSSTAFVPRAKLRIHMPKAVLV